MCMWCGPPARKNGCSQLFGGETYKAIKSLLLTSFTRPLMIVKMFWRISALLEHLCCLNCSHILTSALARSNCLCLLWPVYCDWCFLGLSESFIVGATASSGLVFFLWIRGFLAPNRDIWHFILQWFAHVITFANSFKGSFSTTNTFTDTVHSHLSFSLAPNWYKYKGAYMLTSYFVMFVDTFLTILQHVNSKLQ